MQPYLDLLLAGRKWVECRLTRDARVPYDSIEPGERIYFKQSAGPYRAVAVAEHAMFEAGLTPRRVGELRDGYDHLIRGDDSFWSRKRTANFATLIWLSGVRPACCGPAIPPLQGRAWLTLPGEPPWRRLDGSVVDGRSGSTFTIPLTDANLRNATVSVAPVIDRFHPACLGGRTRLDRGRLLTLRLHDGPVLRCDIDAHKRIFRSRGWTGWWKRHDVHSGDALVCEFVAPLALEIGVLRGGRRGGRRAPRGTARFSLTTNPSGA